MPYDYIQYGLFALTAFGAAVAALLSFGYMTRKMTDRRTGVLPSPEPAAFLFDDKRLVDATEAGRSFLNASPAPGDDWSRLLAFAAPRFPSFEADVARARQLSGPLTLEEHQDPHTLGNRRPLRLTMEPVESFLRISVDDPGAEGRGNMVDVMSLMAMEEELDLMRHAISRLPTPVWHENDRGDVIWANQAYLTLGDKNAQDRDTIVWPLPRFFPPFLPREDVLRRIQISLPDDDDVLWFDQHRFAMSSGHMNMAFSVDTVVKAERALQNFVQTLTKTFADLATGLAVFDRHRKLQLFNPALVTLTQLRAEFLISRPSLHAFWDRLRENRHMPEPKDFRSWRVKMTELENAAATGFHSEIWNLPNGQCYRVTGRPHPDGAIAFLFEDITKETTNTRRFQSEIELGQEALNQLHTAIAVFLSSGELAFSNAAYDRLWNLDPTSSLARITLHDSLQLWSDGCVSPKGQAAWRELISSHESPTEAKIISQSGQEYRLTTKQLTGGAMFIAFTPMINEISDTSPSPLTVTGDIAGTANGVQLPHDGDTL